MTPKVGESRRLGAVGVGVSPAQCTKGVGVGDAESQRRGSCL